MGSLGNSFQVLMHERNCVIVVVIWSVQHLRYLHHRCRRPVLFCPLSVYLRNCAWGPSAFEVWACGRSPGTRYTYQFSLLSVSVVFFRRSGNIDIHPANSVVLKFFTINSIYAFSIYSIGQFSSSSPASRRSLLCHCFQRADSPHFIC